jgi:hypothetical protein
MKILMYKCANARVITFGVMIIFFIASFTLLSCKNNNNGYTGNHLPPKVMQKVLLDINLAEAYCSQEKDSLHKHGEKNLDSLAVHYKDILAHYKITDKQFTESLTWYKNHADKLDTLYSNILPIVTGWQAQKPQSPKGASPH